MLTGCATSGGKAPALPPIPGDIRACFDSIVPKPPAGELSRQQIFKLVADLKQSELSKSQCGKRLIAWYETQAAVLNK